MSPAPLSEGSTAAPGPSCSRLSPPAPRTNTPTPTESAESYLPTDSLLSMLADSPASIGGAGASLRSSDTSSTSTLPRMVRIAQCIAQLAGAAPEGLLDRLVGQLLEGVGSPRDRRTCVQALGAVCRGVGARIAPHLPALVPALTGCCGAPGDEAEDGDALEERDELREHCFAALEALVAGCAAAADDSLLALGLAFSSYDPNYCEDDAMDVEQDEEQEDEEGDDQGEEEEDGSWRVRKAAVRLVSALITGRPAALPRLDALLQCLLGRLRERQETVLLEVLGCLHSALMAAGEREVPVIVGRLP